MHFFATVRAVALLVIALTHYSQASSLPQPVTILDAQHCPYAYAVYKDVPSGFVLVACADLGVVVIAPNGTISTLLPQEACWSPMNLRADPVRGVVYVPCNPTFDPSPTAATSFALSGPGFSQITVVTTGAQCEWTNDLVWDWTSNSLIVGCIGAHAGVYRLTAAGNLTLLVDGNTCQSPATFSLIPPLLYLSCYSGPLPAFHLGVYNFEESTFTPVGGNDFCFMRTWPIVKSTSPVTLLAACFDGQILNITFSAGGPIASNLTNSTQCDSPIGLSFSSSDDDLYVACLRGGGVISIDLQSHETTSLLSSNQCPQPSSVFWDETSHLLYATCINGGLISLSLPSASLSSVADV